MSIQLDEFALLAFTTLIAALSPVILFLPNETVPNPPSPSGFII
jgi:hypothetical protein